MISYGVGMRTQEIGVRVTLGATAADIRRLVLGEAAALWGIGTAIGLLGAFLLSRLVGTLLFEVSATDPLTFAGVSAVLAAAALVAAWLPARRAVRIDPMLALRAE